MKKFILNTIYEYLPDLIIQGMNSQFIFSFSFYPSFNDC